MVNGNFHADLAKIEAKIEGFVTQCNGLKELVSGLIMRVGALERVTVKRGNDHEHDLQKILDQMVELRGQIKAQPMASGKTRKCGWINIYPHRATSTVFTFESDAKMNGGHSRVATVFVEWEE